MNNYPLGDFLIRVKNAALARQKEVIVKHSNFVETVAHALKKLGILDSVEVKEKMLTVRLSYHRKLPVLIDLKLVSKPGLRKHLSVDEIYSRKRRNASTLVISSSNGVVSSKEALKKKMGGEVIAEIW